MNKRRSQVWGLAAILSVLAFSVSFSAVAVEQTVNWPSHGGAEGEKAFSPLTQIDTTNIGQLGLVWSLDLPDEVSLEATPLAVDGVLYFTGTYSKVYAVDALSGKKLWDYDPQIWKHHPDKMRTLYEVNRGAAYDNGKLFSATFDGRLLGFDAKSGKLLWSTDTIPDQAASTITGAPRVCKGKVLIGHGGADYGMRGYVTAYDEATGKQVWRFYITPGTPEQNKGDPAMERAAATWTGEYWKIGTGGGAWDALTCDPGLSRVYIGTANAGPDDPSLRSPDYGDNLYTASIVAVDADTGKYAWHYQVNPRDEWDFDATAQMAMADLQIDGRPRKVLMQAPKNGFYYVLDRTDGKLISAGKLGKVTWADHIDLATGRPVEAKDVRYDLSGGKLIYPSSLGMHTWQTMSFSPRLGLTYIPTLQLGLDFAKGRDLPGGQSWGTFLIKPVLVDGDGKGTLVAWDPVQQKARWTVPLQTMWDGGTLATAGGLVFQGAGDGFLTAYDGASGKVLWRFNAGLGIIAAPISYEVGGKQYVSLLVGYGGSMAFWPGGNAGWKFGAPRRLLTFALDGKAVLPPSAPPDFTVHALDDPSLKLDPASVAAGSQLVSYCGQCHGHDLEAIGAPAPDLRESEIAFNRDTLWSVLHDGTLLDHGMPQFEFLTRQQVDDLYAYIRASARKVLEEQKAGAGMKVPG